MWSGQDKAYEMAIEGFIMSQQKYHSHGGKEKWDNFQSNDKWHQILKRKRIVKQPEKIKEEIDTAVDF